MYKKDKNTKETLFVSDVQDRQYKYEISQLFIKKSNDECWNTYSKYQCDCKPITHRCFINYGPRIYDKAINPDKEEEEDEEEEEDSDNDYDWSYNKNTNYNKNPTRQMKKY